MKGIFHKLPSFAADYSGACGVLYGMGGMTVLCDGSGCFGSFLVLDDPRFYSGPQRIFCAMLRERDVVLGFDQNLIKKIEKTQKVVGGRFTALVGTPVPAIVATDYQGICRALEKRTGIPSIGVDTTGMEFYDAGQTKAYRTLVRRFASPNAEALADVHVIGATPLDMWDVNQTDDLIALLKECGAQNPAVWGSNTAVDEIAGVPKSRLNLAVSVSAIPIVQELQRKYGTPYRIGYPVGRTATRRWSAEITALLAGRSWDTPAAQERMEGLRALIVGEQVTSEAIRELLQTEFGFGHVDVASWFRLDSVLKRPGDQNLVEEEDLTELMRQREPYDLVIGDPLLGQLLAYPAKFLPMPHTAISARIFWDKSPNCFGDKGSDWFHAALTGK